VIIRMQVPEKMSLEEIQGFLEGSEAVEPEGADRAEVYEWVNTILRQHDYEKLGRASKGLMHRYLERVTGYKRAQITRLIG
jgi:hypothetical protein